MPPPLPSRLAALLPGPCEVCRRWSARPICAPCLARHGRMRPRCTRCGLPAAPGQDCAGCALEPSAVDGCRVAFDYAFPWDRLIHALKFGERTELAGPLADALAGALGAARRPAPPGEGASAAVPAVGPVDLVVPVPLSPQRLRERGYNQAWLIARRVARRLGHPADDRTLLRPLDTPQQSGLDRHERRRNLQGAFMVDPAARGRLAGRRIALVDDVVTTGSTVHEAARELKRGGALSVHVWALARTPSPAHD